MVVWDPRRPLGGNSVEALRGARLILWRGWCSVHARFTVAQIAAARSRYPEINVIVHPECRREWWRPPTSTGSTELILDTIGVGAARPASGRSARDQHGEPAGRRASRQADLLPDPVICPCSTMYRIHPAYLAWVLEALVDGDVVNEIVVPDAVEASPASRSIACWRCPAGPPPRTREDRPRLHA